MSEVTIVPAAIKKMSKGKKALIVILFLALLSFAVWYFWWPHANMKKIHELIGNESKNYADPAAVETILLQGVSELRWDRQMYAQAKAYSKSQNIPIEQVLVDTAISMAKQFKYI